MFCPTLRGEVLLYFEGRLCVRCTGAKHCHSARCVHPGLASGGGGYRPMLAVPGKQCAAEMSWSARPSSLMMATGVGGDNQQDPTNPCRTQLTHAGRTGHSCVWWRGFAPAGNPVTHARAGSCVHTCVHASTCRWPRWSCCLAMWCGAPRNWRASRSKCGRASTWRPHSRTGASTCSTAFLRPSWSAWSGGGWCAQGSLHACLACLCLRRHAVAAWMRACRVARKCGGLAAAHLADVWRAGRACVPLGFCQPLQLACPLPFPLPSPVHQSLGPWATGCSALL